MQNLSFSIILSFLNILFNQLKLINMQIYEELNEFCDNNLHESHLKSKSL